MKKKIIALVNDAGFKIIGVAVCSLVCFEFGHSSAFPIAVTVASENHLAQTDTLHLLWLPLLNLPMRSQTS